MKLAKVQREISLGTRSHCGRSSNGGRIASTIRTSMALTAESTAAVSQWAVTRPSSSVVASETQSRISSQSRRFLPRIRPTVTPLSGQTIAQPPLARAKRISRAWTIHAAAAVASA
jgi:hypothetical protein